MSRLIQILLFAFTLVAAFPPHKLTGQVSSDYTLEPTKAITQYIHKVWQSENGLPQNTVTSIVQTRDGFIWLGTLEGLVRFDGIQFTVFDRQNISAMKSNRIWSLCEDRELNLWIGTENGGLVCHNKGRFISYDTSSGLLSNTVYRVYEDRRGNLLVGTSAGLCIMREGRFTEFTAQNRLPSAPVWDICEDFHGTLWLGSNGVFSLENGRFVPLEIQGAVIKSVWALRFDSKDNLWIASNEGLFIAKRGRVSAVKFPNVYTTLNVRALLLDRKGSLWMGTEGGGLFRFAAGRFASFDISKGLSNNSVYALFQDREGSLWIGTNGGGLNQLSDGKFTPFTTAEGLASNFVWSIYQDKKKNLWFGTYEGLTRLSDGVAKSYTMLNGLKNAFIWAIYEDRAANLWLGTGGGLTLFDGNTFRTFEPNPLGADNVIRAILQDSRGRLWVGSSAYGLGLFAHDRFRFYSTSEGLPSHSVRALLEDKDGSLWVGTMNGLSNFRDGKFTTFSTKNGLSSENIRCLYKDSDGVLWIGTEGGGLNRYADGRFVSYTRNAGLFDDLVSQILEDDFGNLWMSCNKGIFRVSRTELNDFAAGRVPSVSCVSYGTADGMKSRECNGGSQPAGWKATDGTLWFPTVQGAVMIDPRNIRLNRQPPPVLINKVVVDSVEYTDLSHIEVPAGSQRFEFHYTALSFIAPEKMHFKYKLEGIDKGWVIAGNRRIAYYTNLPAGSHIFRVTASNSDGVWNLEGASVAFLQKPFFYQTRLVQIVAAFGVGLIVFGAYMGRIRALRSQERALQKLIDERTRDLVAQTKIAQDANKFKSQLLSLAAHDLKSPLISIRGFVGLLRQEVDAMPESAEKADSIQRLSQNMLNLINELLESAELETGKIQLMKKPVDVSLLALTIADLNKPLAEKKRQRITLALDDSGECVVEADVNRLQEAMENLVTNAIKYSPQGKSIFISVRRRGLVVQFSVRDEGPGISADDLPKLFERFQRLSSRPTGDETSSGLGLYIVKQIVDLHGGRVWAETEEGKGSTFSIELSAANSLHSSKNSA